MAVPAAELAALQRSVVRGSPFGDEVWAFGRNSLLAYNSRRYQYELRGRECRVQNEFSISTRRNWG
jgi:hypothetical protein